MARTIVGALILMLALTIAAPLACAEDAVDAPAPDFYVGVRWAWDNEADEDGLTLSVKGGGGGRLGPDVGFYDEGLLVGVSYMALGTRRKMNGLYGGPSLFYYDDEWGGGVTLGTHLSREVILEANFRRTTDWEGVGEIGVAYGLQWPWPK